MYVATNKMAYIDSVNILLPESWTDPAAEPSSSYAFTVLRYVNHSSKFNEMIFEMIFYEIHVQDGAVRVDTPNPLYGNDPFTVQPGGCKDPGQYIHVTRDFLLDLNTTSAQNYGYVGNSHFLRSITLILYQDARTKKCEFEHTQARCLFSNGPNTGTVSLKSTVIPAILSTPSSTM